MLVAASAVLSVCFCRSMGAVWLCMNVTESERRVVAWRVCLDDRRQKQVPEENVILVQGKVFRERNSGILIHTSNIYVQHGIRFGCIYILYYLYYHAMCNNITYLPASYISMNLSKPWPFDGRSSAVDWFAAPRGLASEAVGPMQLGIQYRTHLDAMQRMRIRRSMSRVHDGFSNQVTS